MRAILTSAPGGPEVLQLGERPDLTPGPTEVVIEVAAAGVNRADLLQRQGFYPPPAGASDVIGLECSGIVRAVGGGVAGWSVGDEVCALLSGGGYAEQVLVPAGQVMPLPPGVGLIEAAGVPEVAATVYSNLAMTAAVMPGEWVLIHGGGSGIGSFAIQWARAVGARVAVTAGSPLKLARCAELGAEVLIDYRDGDFVEALRSGTAGHGADVILDIMGAKYLDPNVRALAVAGRIVTIGLQGGVRGELDLGRLLSVRGTIAATSLRARPEAQKVQICAELVEHVWPLFERGDLRPVIDRALPLAQAAEAHRALAAGEVVGKVLLTT